MNTLTKKGGSSFLPSRFSQCLLFGLVYPKAKTPRMFRINPLAIANNVLAEH